MLITVRRFYNLKALKFETSRKHADPQVLLPVEASGGEEGPTCLPQMVSPLCPPGSGLSREVTVVTLVYFMDRPWTFFLNNLSCGVCSFSLIFLPSGPHAGFGISEVGCFLVGSDAGTSEALSSRAGLLQPHRSACAPGVFRPRAWPAVVGHPWHSLPSTWLP